MTPIKNLPVTFAPASQKNLWEQSIDLPIAIRQSRPVRSLKPVRFQSRRGVKAAPLYIRSSPRRLFCSTHTVGRLAPSPITRMLTKRTSQS